MRTNIRMFIDERGAVIDLLMDNNVEILLGAVSSDLLEVEFLVGGHVIGYKMSIGTV